MKNVATFKNEMSTVDSGEGNFDFSNLVVIVKVKLFWESDINQRLDSIVLYLAVVCGPQHRSWRKVSLH